MHADMIARKVLYSGRVQGVGFRYTAVRVAAEYDVTGYVRNLPDGRVELLAQGAPDQVSGFLLAVRQAMSGYIRTAEESELAPSPSFVRFDVRFY